MQPASANRDLPRRLLLAAGNRQTAYCVHLLLAALFFSPFLLFGHILFANTDLFNDNYPALILAKRNFLHGSLGLWNPYVLSGAPQSVSAITPILLPENWPLFLVPERFFFRAITFLDFVKMSLVGIAAYHFYCAELLNRRWALFASIAYQLSGMVIWGLISYVAMSVVLYLTILLALIWTSPGRGTLQNYLLLSVVTILLMMSGDIAHPCYALLGVGIMVLYRAFSRRPLHPVVPTLVVFTASTITALLVFSVRLLPTIETLGLSGGLDTCCKPHFADSSFLITRFFDTEIFGVNFTDSLAVFPRISPLFEVFHVHWVAPSFFGVTVALLALWALAAKKTQPARFWSIFTVIGLGGVTLIEPFDTLARALLSPIYHSFSLEFSLSVGFTALAAHGGMAFERSARRGHLSRNTIELFAAAVAVVALLVVVVVMRNIDIFSSVGSPWARLLVVGLLALAFLAATMHRALSGLVRHATLPLLWALVAASGASILLHFESDRTFLSYLKNIETQLLLFAVVAIVLVLALRGRIETAWRVGAWGGAIGFAFCLVVGLYPWTRVLRTTMSHDQWLALAGLGTLRFALGSVIFFLVMAAIPNRRLPPRAGYIIFLLLLLAEQIPAGKVHSHINANPFYPARTPYPAAAPPHDAAGQFVGMDLANYRVNLPNVMTGPPAYNELFGRSEVCTTMNEVYGIRSYSGFVDAIPNRTDRFFENWTKGEPPQEFCIYAKATSDRFLDLSGVGYAFNPATGEATQRPAALSRVMLFTRFEVISSATGRAVLERLKAPEFQPLEEIVLQQDPGFRTRPSGMNGQHLRFTEVTPDRIEAKVQSDGPALLFFDDSFAPGWIARVDGKAQKVLIADYNFMAVPVPAGESHVVLLYRPRSFLIGSICAAIGLTLLGAAGVVHVFRRQFALPSAPTRHLRFVGRAFRRLAALLLGISLLQILWGPSLLAEDFVAPPYWRLSYVNGDGRTISRSLPAPAGPNSSIEDTVRGPLSIEMALPGCRAYDRYRFWVGPWGADTTTRQPAVWRVFVRGASGSWEMADAEQRTTAYANDHWYKFPLRYAAPCINAIRLEITKFSASDIFRLHAIELSEPSLADRLLRLVAYHAKMARAVEAETRDSKP